MHVLSFDPRGEEGTVTDISREFKQKGSQGFDNGRKSDHQQDPHGNGQRNDVRHARMDTRIDHSNRIPHLSDKNVCLTPNVSVIPLKRVE
jgi:hypothetical protein